MNELLIGAALATGVAIGRVWSGEGILGWIEDGINLPRTKVRYWLAAPLAVLVLAGVWIFRPRRTLENVRTWREEHPVHPAPSLDPEWPRKRQG